MTAEYVSRPMRSVPSQWSALLDCRRILRSPTVGSAVEIQGAKAAQKKSSSTIARPRSPMGLRAKERQPRYARIHPACQPDEGVSERSHAFRPIGCPIVASLLVI